jgi:hypothetical protein
VRCRTHLYPVLATLTSLAFAACGGNSESVPEISASEVAAEVPELDAVHELMYPLWHDAFPDKDYEAIHEPVPQFEPLLAAVDSVQLPGILRDKQERWDEGKAVMLASFASLKDAAESGDNERMLGHTEAFHMAYEQLVRIIRPVVPELAAFHQELYKLYHYYGPANDLAKIREAVAAMAQKMEPLKAATLSGRVADRQAEFDAAVAALEEHVSAATQALQTEDMAAIQAAVEAAHTAYVAVEALFD